LSVQCFFSSNDSFLLTEEMVSTLLDDLYGLKAMNQTILKLHEQKVYHGAYKAIELCDKIQ